jgi:pimeloyl-ACP methyl ester carboxylesterase
MAQDTAMVVRKLKIEPPTYSMGAGIALELAMHYPELVRRLIVASWHTATTASTPLRLRSSWKSPRMTSQARSFTSGT